MILMHMRGTPRTMQRGPFARDVIRDVMTGLREAVARAKRAGLAKIAAPARSGNRIRKKARTEF